MLSRCRCVCLRFQGGIITPQLEGVPPVHGSTSIWSRLPEDAREIVNPVVEACAPSKGPIPSDILDAMFPIGSFVSTEQVRALRCSRVAFLLRFASD